MNLWRQYDSKMARIMRELNRHLSKVICTIVLEYINPDENAIISLLLSKEKLTFNRQISAHNFINVCGYLSINMLNAEVILNNINSETMIELHAYSISSFRSFFRYNIRIWDLYVSESALMNMHIKSGIYLDSKGPNHVRFIRCLKQKINCLLK